MNLLKLTGFSDKENPMYVIKTNEDFISSWVLKDLLISLPHERFYIYLDVGVQETVVCIQEHLEFGCVFFDAAFLINSKDLYSLKFLQRENAHEIVYFRYENLVTKQKIDLFEGGINSAKELERNLHDCTISMLAYLSRTLHEKTTRMANVKRTWKVAKKRFFERDVTYISNIKYLQDPSAPQALRHIEWKHSWIRGGHWRKIRPVSIGKDRSGERNQKGRTWVNESKVNKDLPLLVKPRKLSQLI